MNPAVSIILPTFDRVHYLRAAVASVFEQTFRDWELVIADDGSGEETRSYLTALAARPEVRVLWLPHRGNPPAVRNRALREARGEYIAFLDSDDVWLPGKLGAQVASLRASPGRAWSYTAFTLVDDSGAPLTGRRALRCPRFDGAILDPLLTGDALIVQSSVIARRGLLEKVGGYDEELPVCGDYALWVELACHSDVAFVGEPLVLVRRHREHYCDDIVALEDLDRMLVKVQRSRVAPHLHRVLQCRRAKVAAGLARAHSLNRRPLVVLRTVLRSAGYAWRVLDWWKAVFAALVRVFVPRALLNLVRRRRESDTGAKVGA